MSVSRDWFSRVNAALSASRNSYPLKTENPGDFPHATVADIQLVYTDLNAKGDTKAATLAAYRAAVQAEKISVKNAKKIMERELR